MSFLEIQGANIYYETFGKDALDHVPILLIHGSTVTGQEDWQGLAPLLAQHKKVIVPDCRGHGQSTNPHRSYRFREMADDMAALIRLLGYERAHIIGHSNGGNVALCVLMEHPKVVQTAVLQAANAYVSPDLLEREPHLFDPARVLREAPEWVEQMIALHGPTHGTTYWRELLQMTLQETISEPNYTPADLQLVQRPTLVIQGEKDPANAPGRHAQFIARHIPHAELWLPAGVGHNVHKEIPCEWLHRVQDFQERRGDEINDALYRLRRERFSDERLTVFDLRTHPSPIEAMQSGKISLSGKVLTSDQRQAALDCASLTVAHSPITISAEKVRVLLDDTTPWGLVNYSVVDLRRKPDNHAERVSQALIGEAVRILEHGDEWSFVRLEHDGYLGWMHTSALCLCTQEQVKTFREDCQVTVCSNLVSAYATETAVTQETPELVGILPFGVSLPVETWRSDLALARLPDGRLWWVPRANLSPTKKQPQTDPAAIEAALSLIKRFVGVPYLWGGRTPFGFDCSGLAQAFWGFLGVQIPRDADQQYFHGKPVSGDPQPGDLLFFGDQNPEEDTESRLASISHVAISLGGDEIIHANGSTWNVSYNSLNPQSPRFRPWLREHWVGIRRYP